jgi:hypothetical protein
MKDVTILGNGPSWKECTFRTRELWGATSCIVNPELRDKPFTKIFAFDGLVTYSANNGQPSYVTQDALKICKERGIPLVSTLEFATELYPIREVVRELGSSYFMPTLSYMIALAIYQKYERIYLFGIDAGPRWDYQSGKPHITFWLGVAIGRKIELILGRDSLRWAYSIGLGELPKLIFEDEANSIRSHLAYKFIDSGI